MDLLELESTPQLDNKTSKEVKKEKNIITKTKNTYIHVNSSNRNLVSSNVLDNEIYNLPINPLQITKGSNKIVIKVPNNSLTTDNKIILENAVSTSVEQEFLLTFIENTLYINAAPNTPGFNLIKYIIKNYTTNIQINISGLVGESNITKELNGLYLFNVVPINLINTVQNVLYSTTINNLLGTIFLKINIPKSPITLSGSKTFKISLLSLGGIPLNQINANFPLDSNRAVGYHDVIEAGENYITIKTAYQATDSLSGGGKLIIITSVRDQINAYPTPDFYEVTFLKTFRRISEIKVISSEFPFTNKTLTPKNNKFYWTNLADGNFIYQVTLPEGFYDRISLLNTLISNLNKVNVNNATSKTHLFSYELISLNFTLSSNVSTVLYQPLETDAVVSTSAIVTKYMYINFPYHNLTDGSSIKIQNAISFMGIPASVINSTFTVIVVNQNQIKVILPNYNVDSSSTGQQNGGGNTVSIVVPNNCILINGNFNMLQVLGLEPTTTFANSFTSVKPIMRTLAPYMEMRCILPNNTNNDYNFIQSMPVLTKIQFKGIPGEYIYNRHTDMSLSFEPPMNNLSTVLFQFLYPDGIAVDFEGKDHSFTLLITELIDVHLDSLLENIKS